jgi:mono/diheme cytochrome c family protein
MRQNLLALAIVLAGLILVPAGLFGYEQWRGRTAGVPVIEMVARVPQDGGFTPDHLTLRAGQHVRLRISSPDVVHGFAIPGLGVEVQEILPGRPVEVDVTPEKPGRYAFACTRWCSIDHWRMRGTIDVIGDGVDAPPGTTQPPLFQQLGINLDAPHPQASAVPARMPSAARGAALGLALPADLSDAGRRRAIAPADAFAKLRADSQKAGLTDDQVWDLVAWAWLKDVSSGTLALGKDLYTRDCAACHGPEGRGDGPAGRNLPGLQHRSMGAGGPAAMDTTAPGTSPAGAGNGEVAMLTAVAGGQTSAAGAEPPAGPAKFTDPAPRLAVPDAYLQGKILRGGMGTGMPEFGSLYSDRELWALVAYVRTFVLGE